ncbi:hypothetical protein B0J13DRAFT_64090 [Dactylonectria estremocensis]|uniref:BZIP domain-containing protein n=1 Tax=Dactylonectria estremocensis TaxID=1079267 RepID=A0A9P9J069_9HYPO|nr:hypothetical protein B0J13DRAFT_64090 [Dactylonectria estremocensis]
MDTCAMRDGSFSQIHLLENELSFGAFIIPADTWESQWSKNSSALPGSVEEGTIASVYGGNGFLTSNSIFSPVTSSPDHWNDSHPAAEDTATSMAPESEFHIATSLKEPGRLSRPSTAENENRKRKRHSTKSATRKSTRRRSPKNVKINTTLGESEGNLKNRRRTYSRHSSGQSDQRCDGNSTLIKERDRIASSKFRNKKREDALRLESEEQDMERINRTLSACAANLTREVYELKMKLLQHADCGCTLIQNYIINEAQNYIRELEITA